MLRKRTRYRICSAIFLLMLVGVAAFGAWSGSQLQPPSPRTAEAGGKQQQISATKKEQPNDYAGGTRESPLVVEVLNPPNADAVAAELKKNREHETSREIWDWVFSGLLVAVGVGQGIVLFYTAKVSNKAANAARDAAKAATKSADTEVAIELPIFVIQSIAISKGVYQYIIRFANHGRTPAIIRADCLVLNMAKALQPKPRYPMSEIKEIVQDKAVGNGENYAVMRKRSISDEDWVKIAKSETVLWAYGYVDYLDFMKREHREGFCIGFEPARISGPDKLYTSLPPSGLRWSRSGPPAYTYNRTKEENREDDD